MTGMGDTHIYENPGILSLGLIFFRYHNYRATQLKLKNPGMTSNEIFERSRRWVIATIQVGTSSTLLNTTYSI